MGFLPTGKTVPRLPVLVFSILAAAGLPACSIVSPVPTWELAKTVGAASTAALQIGPIRATDTVLHPHTTPRRWCIEINHDTQVPDIVPALQRELQGHGIESRVFETGQAPLDCAALLQYAAWLRWDQPMWSSEFQTYLSDATLTLRGVDGTVLATTRYEVNGMGIGKWASTQRKMAPLVLALLTGMDG